ncbi:MAG: hypothetical protein DI585_05525 [Pseudomonas fluorescens]|nr:MAG: hypothetical protein DI585_05525 [Pseudomonas fluorescens]
MDTLKQREVNRMNEQDFGLRDLVDEVRGLRGDVNGIKQELEHYRGFIAGAAWCFAGVSAMAGFVWGALFDN